MTVSQFRPQFHHSHSNSALTCLSVDPKDEEWWRSNHAINAKLSRRDYWITLKTFIGLTPSSVNRMQLLWSLDNLHSRIRSWGLCMLLLLLSTAYLSERNSFPRLMISFQVKSAVQRSNVFFRIYRPGKQKRWKFECQFTFKLIMHFTKYDKI